MRPQSLQYQYDAESSASRGLSSFTSLLFTHFLLCPFFLLGTQLTLFLSPCKSRPHNFLTTFLSGVTSKFNFRALPWLTNELAAPFTPGRLGFLPLVLAVRHASTLRYRAPASMLWISWCTHPGTAPHRVAQLSAGPATGLTAAAESRNAACKKVKTCHKKQETEKGKAAFILTTELCNINIARQECRKNLKFCFNSCRLQ